VVVLISISDLEVGVCQNRPFFSDKVVHVMLHDKLISAANKKKSCNFIPPLGQNTATMGKLKQGKRNSAAASSSPYSKAQAATNNVFKFNTNVGQQ
jgi:hypothetical protein